jgi:hypothetical protein
VLASDAKISKSLIWVNRKIAKKPISHIHRAKGPGRIGLGLSPGFRGGFPIYFFGSAGGLVSSGAASWPGGDFGGKKNHDR